jgi:hypothetical protein
VTILTRVLVGLAVAAVAAILAAGIYAELRPVLGQS